MSRPDITALRLTNQHLASPTLSKAAQVVSALGAVQAQEYDRSKWGIGMRLRDARDRDIEQAMTDGAILRTHVLRPTWHFVAPADIRWMLTLTGPRVSAAMASYNRKLELDANVFRRSRAAIARALRDGRQLTRQELKTVLERARIDVSSSQRLGHLMMQGELDGMLVSGARRGKQFTYALLEERVSPTPSRDRDDALLELTTRYFTTRGPATPQDFSWWSGLTMADAKRGIEAAGANVQRITVDGRTYWLGADAKPVRLPKASAFLLPVYDEYGISYKDRSAMGRRVDPAEWRKKLGMVFDNMIVVNGQLVGTWNRSFAKNAVVVEMKRVTQTSGAEQRAIVAAVEQYAKFLELPVEIRDDQ
jgi:hypothetical protein